METVGGKIRRVIKEKGFRTVKEFYDELKRAYGKSAINRSTLTRLLKDQVEVRERTLNQIAIILGVKTSFLREGTDAEVSALTPAQGIFTFNDRAATRILQRDLPFAVEQLTLKAGGRTADLKDSTEDQPSVKWIYVLVGKVNVVIGGTQGQEVRALHKSQSTAFNSQHLHRIENVSGSTSLCLSVHYPARQSTFYPV